MQRSLLATTRRLNVRQISRPPVAAPIAFRVGRSVIPSRPYASLAQEELSKKSPLSKIRFSHVFGGLAILGLFVTTYGL
jgi:hypothetical protein